MNKKIKSKELCFSFPIENISYIEKYRNKEKQNYFCNETSKKSFSEIKKTDPSLISFSHLNLKNKFRLKKNNLENSYQILLEKEKRIVSQIKRYFREKGHLESCLNPIELRKNTLRKSIQSFFLKKIQNLYKIQEKRDSNNLIVNRLNKLKDLIFRMNQIYCQSIGFEYMHIEDEDQRNWIQNKIEKTCIFSKDIFETSEKIQFLSDLVSAEELEKYLAKVFPGEKRFSLEGIDVLIPMLRDIIISSEKQKITKIVLGMAHRGRINVLVNIFGKPLKKIFQKVDEMSREEFFGDVEYHYGGFSIFKIRNKTIELNLSFNPSHLEIVNPVVMGMTRGYIDKLKKNPEEILSITIHGDASVIGQGVVQETINLYKIEGYSVGGTIRIILNNQIGFTTSKKDFLRSSRYCTDIFKFTQFPIFHVNADDIESVIFVSRLALDFRKKFKKDVIIDLVGYRRRGHSEIDDPKATQPIMYRSIDQHNTSKSIYFEKLNRTDKIVNRKIFQNMIDSYRKKLNARSSLSCEATFIDDFDCMIQNSEIYPRKDLIQSENLQKILQKINSVPKNFKLHPLVKKILQNRLKISLKESPCDWATAEILAYATLMIHGFDIRISGEDVSRGTFFQRHLKVYDQVSGKELFLMKNIKDSLGTLKIWDSVLSEESTLAFEYGYSLINNRSLTIWEAQFGDFSNVAQVVVDQFISSGKKKWGTQSNLVLFLPHGCEGQGPDHSSARIERYLQLCAEKNMKILIPSNPSQIYHALTDHCLMNRSNRDGTQRNPLIIFSPKSLLHHSKCRVHLKELFDSKFHSIIEEKFENEIQVDIKKIIFCCGKIYYELSKERRIIGYGAYRTLIIRIEQLYPFPQEELKDKIQKYNRVTNFIWCQEEPKNQGAWSHVKGYIRKIIPNYAHLSYFGRSKSATSSEGNYMKYKIKQKQIIQSALSSSY